MTICEGNILILTVWIILSVLIPIIVFFLLNKISKKKWLSILVAVVLFLVLFFSTPFIDSYFLVCTGPLINIQGNILA